MDQGTQPIEELAFARGHTGTRVQALSRCPKDCEGPRAVAALGGIECCVCALIMLSISLNVSRVSGITLCCLFASLGLDNAIEFALLLDWCLSPWRKVPLSRWVSSVVTSELIRGLMADVVWVNIAPRIEGRWVSKNSIPMYCSSFPVRLIAN